MWVKLKIIVWNFWLLTKKIKQNCSMELKELSISIHYNGTTLIECYWPYYVICSWFVDLYFVCLFVVEMIIVIRLIVLKTLENCCVFTSLLYRKKNLRNLIKENGGSMLLQWYKIYLYIFSLFFWCSFLVTILIAFDFELKSHEISIDYK